MSAANTTRVNVIDTTNSGTLPEDLHIHQGGAFVEKLRLIIESMISDKFGGSCIDWNFDIANERLVADDSTSMIFELPDGRYLNLRTVLCKPNRKDLVENLHDDIDSRIYDSST